MAPAGLSIGLRLQLTSDQSPFMQQATRQTTMETLRVTTSTKLSSRQRPHQQLRTLSVGVTPSSRTVVPTGVAQYTVTVTPLAGFTGSVTLGTTGLPTGASSVFNPGPVVITDATVKDIHVDVDYGREYAAR